MGYSKLRACGIIHWTPYFGQSVLSGQKLISPYLRHDVTTAVYDDEVSLFAEWIEITVQQLKRQLKSKHEMTDLGEMNGFLEIEIKRDRKARTMRLDQGRYIDEVLPQVGRRTVNR